jgi:hypothetical protein
MTVYDRHYRSAALRIALGVTALLVVVGLVLLAVEDGGPVFFIIDEIALLIGVPYAVRALRSSGVIVSENGVRSPKMFGGAYVWRWDEIETSMSVNSRVFAKLRSGRSVGLVGVAQGYKTVWQAGETRDVVGELNAALEASRSANGAA